MKVLFFNPMIKLFYKPTTSPLGLLSIASFLNANGHSAKIYDRFLHPNDISMILEDFQPDIIGISLITNRFIDDALEISAQVKKRNLPVVWGGPLATEIPEEILKTNIVDFISLNEGEETWLDILNNLSKGFPLYNIKGLAYLQDNKMIKTDDRDFIELEKLPPIDWSLINVEKYFQPYYQSKKMLYMYSSKGCIGNCSFCYNAQFHHSKHRKRPYEHLFSEIKYLNDNYGMDGINFADDLMFCNKKQTINFCNELLEKNLPVFWGGNLRVGIINDLSDFELMHRAGCRWLLIGVETGSPRIQHTISKNIPFDKIIKTFDLCSQAGIISIAPFMIGLPGETPEDLKMTVDLAKKLKATVCAFNFFTPIPGTAMYNDLIKQNKYVAPSSLRQHASLYFGEKLTCNVSNVSSKELRAVWKYFQLRSLLFKNKFNDANGEKRLFVKIIKNALRAISGHGLFYFLQAGFSGFFELIYAFTIFFQPKIRAKYGLYFKHN